MQLAQEPGDLFLRNGRLWFWTVEARDNEDMLAHFTDALVSPTLGKGSLSLASFSEYGFDRYFQRVQERGPVRIRMEADVTDLDTLGSSAKLHAYLRVPSELLIAARKDRDCNRITFDWLELTLERD